MATERSHPVPVKPRSISELVVIRAEGDLLELEPLDLGPGAPGTAALEAERGPEPPRRDAA
jgi:hypothetical protein